MPRALFFDLDGTLTDPRQGIVNSFRHAIRGLGLPERADSEIEAFIGPPLHGSFEKLLSAAGHHAPDRDATVLRAVELYREHFGAKGLFENRLYDGIRDVLASLSQAGHRLFVVTSKPSVYAERIVEHFALGDFFVRVHGPDLAGNRADKAELIAHVLAHEEIAPEHALMIGDRSHDIVGATANSVASIGVLWGYGDHAELTTAGAGRLCAEPAELYASIIRLTARDAADV